PGGQGGNMGCPLTACTPEMVTAVARPGNACAGSIVIAIALRQLFVLVSRPDPPSHRAALAGPGAKTNRSGPPPGLRRKPPANRDHATVYSAASARRWVKRYPHHS